MLLPSKCNLCSYLTNQRNARDKQKRSEGITLGIRRPEDNLDSPSVTFFVDRLTALLAQQPEGTTAELTDVAVGYLDVDGLVGIFLSKDGKGSLDEEFEFDENTWLNWSPELDAWLDKPTYAMRPDFTAWRAFRHGRLAL